MGGLHDLECALQVFIYNHYSSSVVVGASIVRCGEHRDQLAIRKELIPVHNHLVGSHDQLQVEAFQELIDQVWSNKNRHVTVRIWREQFCPGVWI